MRMPLVLHTFVNAWQDGADILVDSNHDAAPIELEGFARALVRGIVERPLGSSLRRLRIAPEIDAVRTEIVLDRAERSADGPSASCHFDHPIPFGFHSVWNADNAAT